MFEGLSEEVLDKVYDWISQTYYSARPIWNRGALSEHEQAIHALDDMRALFSGVGNNGWWDEDRVRYLKDLNDIGSATMREVLMVNTQLREYYKKREEAQSECFINDEEFDWDEFKRKHAPEVEKMQGNKDGELYKYKKKLFWDSVEWFLQYYATEEERGEVEAMIEN